MKRLPTLTRSQRRALLLVEWVLLIGIIVFSIWGPARFQTPSASERPSNSQVPRKGTNAKAAYYSAKEGEEGRESSLPKETPFESFAFDPNTADSATLLRLGLSPWQVRSIYRYRAKHGRYHKLEDFMHVPGLTNEQWDRLRPYIRIATEFQYVAPAVSPEEERRQGLEAMKAMQSLEAQDSFPRQEKIAFGQTIDINTADTSLLKMIPGIASKRAARIVAYRRSLGGFVNIEQAMEAIEMPDSVLKYMTLSPVAVTKINVNKLSVQQLMKHPYLNFYQSKAIFEHRQNKGDLHSLDELSHLEGFRQTDLDRLRHYITFE
ncbi:MAG: helix-hairpin-helix domain-containing protein [Bacteroidaceae bacterium]|nr:helix-hairpin-helix domain-containing protein [Bacteroidaceae bacterium]